VKALIVWLAISMPSLMKSLPTGRPSFTADALKTHICASLLKLTGFAIRDRTIHGPTIAFHPALAWQ
jgi:hypothetical protein